MNGIFVSERPAHKEVSVIRTTIRKKYVAGVVLSILFFIFFGAFFKRWLWLEIEIYLATFSIFSLIYVIATSRVRKTLLLYRLYILFLFFLGVPSLYFIVFLVFQVRVRVFPIYLLIFGLVLAKVSSAAFNKEKAYFYDRLNSGNLGGIILFDKGFWRISKYQVITVVDTESMRRFERRILPFGYAMGVALASILGEGISFLFLLLISAGLAFLSREIAACWSLLKQLQQLEIKIGKQLLVPPEEL